MRARIKFGPAPVSRTVRTGFRQSRVSPILASILHLNRDKAQTGSRRYYFSDTDFGRPIGRGFMTL